MDEQMFEGCFAGWQEARALGKFTLEFNVK